MRREDQFVIKANSITASVRSTLPLGVIAESSKSQTPVIKFEAIFFHITKTFLYFKSYPFLSMALKQKIC